MAEENDEFIDLAAELMVPSEEKEIAPRKREEEEEEQQKASSPGPEQITVNEVINPEDSAEYLVDGIDALLGIVTGTVYALKSMSILTPAEKKLVSAARKKIESELTPEEVKLIDYLEARRSALDERADNADLTEKERAKLKKSSKAMIKVRNWKIGPEFGFWIVLADIVSDRVIDMAIDD